MRKEINSLQKTPERRQLAGERSNIPGNSPSGRRASALWSAAGSRRSGRQLVFCGSFGIPIQFTEVQPWEVFISYCRFGVPVPTLPTECSDDDLLLVQAMAAQLASTLLVQKVAARFAAIPPGIDPEKES